ncbi:MAG TPA: hypothetical protein VJ376_18150 [Pseudomonadota bacterium]|nr:hypothetical protein [Pseudomonadota bacterium]
MRICLVLLLSLAALTACAAKPSRTRPPMAPHEIIDEQTAGTLTVAAKPLVFARDRSDVAAYARDYVTLVAIEDDRSGEFSQYLLLYRWSTVDKRMSAPPGADAGALRILADARAIDLKPLDDLPVSLSKRRELHVPGHGEVAAHAYTVDAELLRFIGTSRELAVRMPQERLDTPFALYEDGRPALLEFLNRVTGP